MSNKKFIICLFCFLSNGVCRSVTDDSRTDYKDSYFYRLNISDANLTVKKQYAVDFALAQLGKPYSIHLPLNTAYNSANWYCSELVWASYMSQNINIVPGQSTPAAVLPYSFESSSVLVEIDIGR